MNRIQELRKAADLTQERLADILNINRSVISKYENEQVPLSDDLIRQLCEIFDVSSDYLLGISDIRDKSASQDDIIKMALFGNRDIDDELVNTVKEFSAFVAQQNKKNKTKE